MSGSGVFIWDVEQGIPDRDGGVISASAEVPGHETDTENYQHFMQVIDAFIADAQHHYPDMEYMGHTLTYNGVYIEPIPYDILTVFYEVIVEAAVNNGLCVYDDLSDQLFTPADKDSHALGDALMRWEAQKSRDKARAELIAADDYVSPENAKETKQLINKIFRDRLKQAGIKNVKKSSTHSYYADFGDIQLELFIKIDILGGRGEMWLTFLSNAVMHITDNHFHLYNPLLEFVDVYPLPTTDTDGSTYFMETVDDFPLFIHQATDMFIDAYPHVQSLSDMFDYFSNKQEETKLSNRFIGDRVCEPIRYKTLLTLAKLSKPNYPILRDQYREIWIDWEVKKYHFEKKSYEDNEEAIYQRRKGDYKKIPFSDLIEGDVDTVIAERVDADLAEIDSLDVDAILAMDLPRAIYIE